MNWPGTRTAGSLESAHLSSSVCIVSKVYDRSKIFCFLSVRHRISDEPVNLFIMLRNKYVALAKACAF